MSAVPEWLKAPLRPVRDYARWWLARPPLPAGPARLHLGCGSVLLDGFVNIDAYPRRGAHLVRDVTSAALWPAGAARLIYACHVLEHVPRDSLHEVLSRWFSILETGGTLRVSVPDFRVLYDIYTVNGQVEQIAPTLMGGQSHALDFHYSMFDRASLERALHEAGFSEIRAWDPAEFPELLGKDWSSFRVKFGGSERWLSLNLEAQKK